MSRYKGASRATAITAEDLAVIVDCYRRIQRIGANLNHASPQHFPLMAVTATLRACWADLSGASVMAGWSYPDSGVTSDGLAPGVDRRRASEPESYVLKLGTDL